MASSNSDSSEKYPYPNEVKVRDFVPIKLTGRSNYTRWRKLMLRLIKTQGLVGFINGEVSAPPEVVEVPDDSSTNVTREIEIRGYRAWKRTDALLQSWIIGSIDEHLIEIVEDFETAGPMWAQLGTVFEDSAANTITEPVVERRDLKFYEPLYKAAVIGDWESARVFLEEHPGAVRARITEYSKTALTVAVKSATRNHFVKKLLDFMSPNDLVETDSFGGTALHRAAVEGNLEAAKLMVNKHSDLASFYSPDLAFPPIFTAAYYGNREMTLFLWKVTHQSAEFRPYEGDLGARLVKNLIQSGLYDITPSLVRQYKLALKNPSPLELMAAEPSAFPSGARLNWWQSLIYKYVPLKFDDSARCCNGGDIENPGVADDFCSVKQRLPAIFWKVTEILVPQMTQIREKKLMHSRAIELLKHVCEEIARVDNSRAPVMVVKPLQSAIDIGISEVVEEILASFPGTIFQEKISLYKMFHLAISNRNEKVFNLIYQFPKGMRGYFLSRIDGSGNNGLHLAGYLRNEQILKLRIDAAGAALQMQRELQWFMEVEKLLSSRKPHVENKEKKTPRMVFTETHQRLVKEGEKWMKDTATSCSIVAALIVTITFAAAITIPGGNNGGSGLPTFSRNIAFKAYVSGVLLKTCKSFDMASFSETHQYPYLGEVKVREFVPVKLSGGSNYSKWGKLMLRLMETQGLLGFINGEVSASVKTMEVAINGAEQTENQDYRAWKKADALLQSWIIGTMDEDLFEIVEDLTTSRDMWTTLEVVFEDSHTNTKTEYPYPSEVKVGEFVPIKLSRSNYSIWCPLMFGLAETQGLGGFITGEVGAPPATVTLPDGTKKIGNPDYKAWRRSDALLQSWIVGTINEDLLAYVVTCKTAHKMWTKLAILPQHSSAQSISDSETETAVGAIHHQTEWRDVKSCEPLYKAVVSGDWERCEEFLKDRPEAVTARITESSETALAVAVSSARRNHVVKHLLDLMSPEDLSDPLLQATALDVAAAAGNVEAAKLLVKKNPNLPNRRCLGPHPPIFYAALRGHRDMTAYLMAVTQEDPESPIFQGTHGAVLVRALLENGLYDIALPLVKRHKLACLEPSALEAMATDPSAFSNGSHFNWWQTLIYMYAPSNFEDSAYRPNGGDIENPVLHNFISVKQKLILIFWKVTRALVPQMKQIQAKKLMHSQALELLKHVCEEIAKWDNSRVPEKVIQPLKTAIKVGHYEVVEEILASFPGIIIQGKIRLYETFHRAILNRNEKIFNLIYQFPEESRGHLLSQPDESGNNGLHLAGCLRNWQILKLRIDAAGAALQMQRELQWFEEVAKLANAWKPHVKNKEKKTPKMVFTETHQGLVKDEEQWMKETATSCTIVAALIVTITFAAAITVPGGSHGDSGLPIFSKNKFFKAFGMSDAVALFMSTSSVLMFLSILTSRYAEVDFLLVLSRKLIIGLLTLFISIISMMIAFGATFYLMFGDKNIWILVLVIVFSCIPVTLFAFLQFPLLFELIKSTYFPHIFQKQGVRMLG